MFLLPFSAYPGERVCAPVSGCRKERRERKGRSKNKKLGVMRLSTRYSACSIGFGVTLVDAKGKVKKEERRSENS